MAAGLRDQLIGAWKLISYQELPVDGSPSFYPMGEKAVGIIMYTLRWLYVSSVHGTGSKALCIGRLVQGNRRRVQAGSFFLRCLFGIFPCR